MDADDGVGIPELGFGRIHARLDVAGLTHGPQAGDALAVCVRGCDPILEGGRSPARLDATQHSGATDAEFFLFVAELAVVLPEVQIGVEAGDELAGGGPTNGGQFVNGLLIGRRVHWVRGHLFQELNDLLFGGATGREAHEQQTG